MEPAAGVVTGHQHGNRGLPVPARSNHTRTHSAGISPLKPQAVFPSLFRFGVSTTLFSPLPNHAPHQLKVLLAVIKCRHRVISHRSAKPFSSPRLWGSTVTRLSCSTSVAQAASGSSENRK